MKISTAIFVWKICASIKVASALVLSSLESDIKLNAAIIAHVYRRLSHTCIGDYRTRVYAA